MIYYFRLKIYYNYNNYNIKNRVFNNAISIDITGCIFLHNKQSQIVFKIRLPPVLYLNFKQKFK